MIDTRQPFRTTLPTLVRTLVHIQLCAFVVTVTQIGFAITGLALFNPCGLLFMTNGFCLYFAVRVQMYAANRLNDEPFTPFGSIASKFLIALLLIISGVTFMGSIIVLFQLFNFGV